MRRGTVILLTVSVVIIFAGCVGTGPDAQQNNGQGDTFNTPEESRTTQTDVNVTEEGGSVTYTLTSLDERTDKVVVRDGNANTIYTFDGVGDTYTIEASKMHSVVAYQNEKEILLE